MKAYHPHRSKKKTPRTGAAGESTPRFQHSTRPAIRLTAVKQVTFGDAAQLWLEHKRPTVKESTLAIYAGILHSHLLPGLGETPLGEITSESLRQFLQSKLYAGRTDGGGGLSRKTVADLRSVVNLVLKFALEQGYTHSAVQIPSFGRTTPVIRTLDRQEQKKLENYLMSRWDPVHLGILLSLYAGLRIGELCALRWGDIRFDTATLHVSRTLLRIQDTTPGAAAKTKLVFSSPKSFTSRRVIPLPEFLMGWLNSNRRPEDTYVLTGTFRFLEPRCCLNRYKRVLEKAGVSDYNFHALRHTFATRCVEQGFDIKSLSEIMGHANVNITMQRYIHPTMDQKRAQMNRLSPFCEKP